MARITKSGTRSLSLLSFVVVFNVASFFIFREYATTACCEKSLSNSNQSVKLSAQQSHVEPDRWSRWQQLSPGGRTASSLGDFPHPTMTLWRLNCHFFKSWNTICREKSKKKKIIRGQIAFKISQTKGTVEESSEILHAGGLHVQCERWHNDRKYKALLIPFSTDQWENNAIP